MPGAQTTVQDSETIRYGSGKLEIGAILGALVDCGAITGAEFEDLWAEARVNSDNAGIISNGIRDQRCTFAWEMMEVNLLRMAAIFAGVHTYNAVLAAPTSVLDETHTLTGTVASKLTYKNYDDSEADAIVVTNAAGAVTLVRDCDYLISVAADGYTQIARAYPTVIEAASILITMATPANTYTLSAGGWDVQPAVGDHILVSGAAEAANNGVKTVTAVSGTVITVSETLAGEAEGATIVITRGGIASGDIVLVDYDYTPAASRTLDSGGLTTFTPQILQFTNTDENGDILRLRIWKVTPVQGAKFTYPADSAVDPMKCPMKVQGELDVDRAAGYQLYNIYDEQDSA